MKHLITISFFLSFAATGRAEWQLAGSPMLTKWGRELKLEQVWSEHPRPQLQRKSWTNLNGLWSYAVAGKGDDETGRVRLLSAGKGEVEATVRSQLLSGEILVPFCPESSLSGVGRLIEPGESLWYQRALPAKPVAGERTLLHFEAVDYETTVWVNDKEVGNHVGGNIPFTFDITAALTDGPNQLVVRANDATEGYQLNGKQALKPGTITYTRVSGIWQTVWLEQVPERYVEDLDFETVVETPEARDQDQGVEEKTGMRTSLLLKAKLGGVPVADENVRVTVSFGGKEVAVGKGSGKLAIEIPEPMWWTPDKPNLYDLKVELLDGGGKILDSVQSYTALRTVGKVRGAGGHLQIALNGKATFLYGPLDQGWWPDGLLTPPSDEAMLSDLQFLKAAGFNMLRKHVKVENSRYYYHCDRLGIAVWQDQVSAGLGSIGTPADVSPRWTRMNPNPKDAIWPEEAKKQWIAEYKEMVDHLHDHPSILIWSLFNEAWGQHDSLELGKMAGEYDSTRLVSIASGGNFWPVGDIASQHHYTEPEFPFADPRFENFIKVCGEMGGYGLAVEGHLMNPAAKAWGYGGKTVPLFDWKVSYSATANQLASLRDQGLSAGVYTQTSDIVNEVNGLLTYDRVPKVDAAWLKKINDAVIRGRTGSRPRD
jgi:beta-galactosidase/beta-glucuronidase